MVEKSVDCPPTTLSRDMSNSPMGEKGIEMHTRSTPVQHPSYLQGRWSLFRSACS